MYGTFCVRVAHVLLLGLFFTLSLGCLSAYPRLWLTSTDAAPAPGTKVEVVLWADPDGQPLSALSAYINVNPQHFVVSDLALAPDMPLSLAFEGPARDSVIGTLDYSGGTLSDFPTGPFKVLTFSLSLKEGAAFEQSELTFANSFPRESDMVGVGATGSMNPDLEGWIFQPFCTLTDAGLSSIACQDNGTAADPTDDFIKFSLNPAGTYLGQAYRLSGPGFEPATYAYGTQQVLTSRPGTAGKGDLTLLLEDTLKNCFLEVVIADPGTCSEVCVLNEAGLDQIQCNSNGTPADSTDDYWTFRLNPSGEGLGSVYQVMGNGMDTVFAPYGNARLFSTLPGTAGTGDMEVLVMDTLRKCTLRVQLPDPGRCSQGCEINFSNVSEVACNDNNTPLDTMDDFLTFVLNPVGSQVGDKYAVLGGGINGEEGNYGVPRLFQTVPGTLGKGPISFSILDQEKGCSLNFTVQDPGICSDTCGLTRLGLDSVRCADNGTLLDGEDDYIRFNLDPEGHPVGTPYQLLIGDQELAGLFGSPIRFSTLPGTAGKGDLTAYLVAKNCSTRFTLRDPGMCGGTCSLTDLVPRDIRCEDNGTPGVLSDDYISFSLFPVGGTPGKDYFLSGPGMGRQRGLYGGESRFRTLPGTAGTLSVDVQLEDTLQNCSVFFRLAHAGCDTLPGCRLTDPGLGPVRCNDNGTTQDSTDDFVFFTLNPLGAQTGEYYVLSAPGFLTQGRFGETKTVVLGPGSAGGGDVVFTLADEQSPECKLTFTLTDPGPCSSPRPLVPSLALTARPRVVPASGGQITYRVALTNLSPSEAFTLYQLTDDRWGSIDVRTNPRIKSTTCVFPQSVFPGESVPCQYTVEASGEAGQTWTNRLTARVGDALGRVAEAADTASFVWGPPWCGGQVITRLISIEDSCLEENNTLLKAIPDLAVAADSSVEAYYLLVQAGVIRGIKKNPRFIVTTETPYSLHLLWEDSLFQYNIVPGTTTLKQVYTYTRNLGTCSGIDTVGIPFNPGICRPLDPCEVPGGTLYELDNAVPDQGLLGAYALVMDLSPLISSDFTGDEQLLKQFYWENVPTLTIRDTLAYVQGILRNTLYQDARLDLLLELRKPLDWERWKTQGGTYLDAEEGAMKGVIQQNYPDWTYWEIGPHSRLQGIDSLRGTLSLSAATTVMAQNRFQIGQGANTRVNLPGFATLWEAQGTLSYKKNIVSGPVTGKLHASTLLQDTLPCDSLPFQPFVLGFSGIWADQQARLKWEVMSQGNQGFVALERSADGILYTELARYVAQDSRPVPESITYRDFLPENASAVYYRLRVQKGDGAFFFKGPLLIGPSAQPYREDVFQAYPNPVKGTRVKLYVPEGYSETFTYRLVDFSGRVLKAGQMPSGKVVELDMEGVPPGNYLIHMVGAEFAVSFSKVIMFQ